jgi:putative ABC transport system permease protein
MWATHARDMHEPFRPVAYLPFTATYQRATFVVRTVSRNPLALADRLRQTIAQARPDLYVSSVRTQNELIESHTVRERLLAVLALFFGMVALFLAGIGLYGLLTYSVLQRRRETGIRIALGGHPAAIALQFAGKGFAVVLLGTVLGWALGMGAVRNIETLLFEVKPTDVWMLTIPGVTILILALLASMPAAVRAAHIDPVRMLRVE